MPGAYAYAYHNEGDHDHDHDDEDDVDDHDYDHVDDDERSASEGKRQDLASTKSFRVDYTVLSMLIAQNVFMCF